MNVVSVNEMGDDAGISVHQASSAPLSVRALISWPMYVSVTTGYIELYPRTRNGRARRSRACTMATAVAERPDPLMRFGADVAYIDATTGRASGGRSTVSRSSRSQSPQAGSDSSKRASG